MFLRTHRTAAGVGQCATGCASLPLACCLLRPSFAAAGRQSPSPAISTALPFPTPLHGARELLSIPSVAARPQRGLDCPRHPSATNALRGHERAISSALFHTARGRDGPQREAVWGSALSSVP